MTRDLEGAVAVITGASSGIGRATAHEFAEHGANVVLAARRDDKLEDAAEECRKRGVEAFAVPADVTHWADVEGLARAALERFGRIDVWVNNAGIYQTGRIEDMPLEDIRRVLDTNLMGVIHGSRAAIPHFRTQGRGVLINIASLDAIQAAAFHSIYSASKFGVRGLSEALRQELFELPDVHVCTVEPAVIDTPLWDHAINRSGRQVEPPPPVYDPALVARAVADLALHPEKEVVVGRMGKVMAMQKRVAPRLTDRIMNRYMRGYELRDRPAGATAGAAYSPVHDPLTVRGGWQAVRGGHTVRNALLAAGAVAAGAWLIRSGRSGR